MITHYPVLECLVAFVVVFLIGYLCAKSSSSRNALVVPLGRANP